jgi:outer membrane protein
VYLQAAPPSLHLADAEKVALEHQPTVKQARAQTGVAEAREISARAPILPQVDLQASYTRARGSTLNRTGGTATGIGGTATGTGGTAGAVGSSRAGGSDIFAFGASATQVLWDFGQTYRKYQAAERFTLSTEAQQKVAEQSVVLDVRRTYFAARAQKELLGVANDALTNQQRHLEQITGFVAVGTRPEIDVAQAKTDVANARVQVINAQNAYALAKAQLSRAMGDPSAIELDVSDDELAPIDGEDFAPARLNDKAIAERKELTVLTRQRESQELTLRGLEGGYAPTLSARGSYQELGATLDRLGPAWNVGVVLDWPIFQGGLTKGQVREAEANLAVTNAQIDAEKLQIAIDVQQSQLNLRNAKATQEATKEVVENARDRLRLAEGRYAQGVGSVIELGDAQLAMTQANAQLVQAKFNVSSARAELLYAMGQR